MATSPNSSAPSAESATPSARSGARDRPPFFLSLRWRITLWYGGALALFMLLFALAVFVGARRALMVSVAQRVSTVAEQLIAYAGYHANGPFGPVSTIMLLSDQQALDGFSGPGLYIEAYNASGYPIGKSSNLGSLDIPTSGYRAWRRVPTGLGGAWGTGAVGVTPVAINRRTLISGDRMVATLYVAESLVNTQRVQRRLGAFLLTGFLLAVGLIAAASMWLARAAVGPINEIARAAREIGDEDMKVRLGWQGRNDELGRLAATFDDMAARLEAAFARERRFVADASHELKTPLTVINANAQMLERWAQVDPAARDEAVGTIRAESAQMARIIGTMLALARTESPEALTFEPVDLAATVREVATTFAPAGNEKELFLNVDCAPVSVRGEPGLLRQLVANLLENAVKFTEQGGVWITLRAQDGRALLTVRDTGPGIAPEALPHLFDRFYRADPAHSRTIEGTGLGLALAKSIARVHGGSIAVESVPGEGSAFTVSLPAQNSPAT